MPPTTLQITVFALEYLRYLLTGYLPKLSLSSFQKDSPLEFRIVVFKRQRASESRGNLEGMGPSPRSSDIRNLLPLGSPPGDLATRGPHSSGWLTLSIYLCQLSWEQANYIPFTYHTSVAQGV